jgi:N-acyl homoserine lactone hydrolase
MKIHAIQTGIAHVKSDFLRGSAALGGTAPFMFHLFTDKQYVDLPIYCWVIEHHEGVIVIDSGEQPDNDLSFITQSRYTVRPEEALTMQLERRGIRPHDVSKVILTHAHGDHIDGLAGFEGVPIYLGADEYAFYKSTFGGMFTRRTSRLPKWFDPKPLVASGEAFGPFDRCYPITEAGDVFAVSTPGHSIGHISVIVQDGDVNYFIAGDMTYSEQGLVDQKLQGPTVLLDKHVRTLQQGLAFVQSQPTIYLPSHDWESGKRLENKQIVEVSAALHV